ncbi:MAG: DJ-1/PfpI family protein [Clostridia bacterium]|nr:DJ-1/PfpI family protein [Clostridia bacterium]
MVYIFLADGFEETEMIAPWDVLIRGGLEVKTVGVTGEYVKGAHGMVMKSDISLNEVMMDEGDMFILPGGMPGTSNLDECDRVREIILNAYNSGKYVAAICAAPMILGKLGILKGRKATCFPGFEEYLEGAQLVREHSVRDGKVITAIGAGGALEFGFNLLACFDEEKASDVRKSMQYEL